jgi:hypothetical protein
MSCPWYGEMSSIVIESFPIYIDFDWIPRPRISSISGTPNSKKGDVRVNHYNCTVGIDPTGDNLREESEVEMLFLMSSS